MNLILLAKLLAAPLLIGLASLAGKRWGPSAAGLMGGLPLVGGPIILVVWLASGAEAAAHAIQTAPVGVWATLCYLLTYGFASARWRWPVCLALGWTVYLTVAVLIHHSGLEQSHLPGLVILPFLWWVATRVLPRPALPSRLAPLPRSELFARMMAAAGLVWLISTAGESIGPQMTGVLSGAPVAASVIPSFTLATSGRGPTLLALRGFMSGQMGFSVFFLVLAATLPVLGLWSLVPALAAAIATGLLGQRLIRWTLTRRGALPTA